MSHLFRPLKIEDLASNSPRKGVTRRSRSGGRKTSEERLSRDGSSADAIVPNVTSKAAEAAAGKRKKPSKRSTSRDDPTAAKASASDADQQQETLAVHRSASGERLVAGGTALEVAKQSRKDKSAKGKRSKSANSRLEIAADKEVVSQQHDESQLRPTPEPEVGTKKKRNKDKRKFVFWLSTSLS